MSQESESLKAAREELDRRYNKIVGVASSNLCTHCGWCVDQCHYYLATKDPTITPVAKAERVRRVYKRHHDWMSRIFPFWTGAKELTEQELDEWRNSEMWKAGAAVRSLRPENWIDKTSSSVAVQEPARPSPERG